MTKLMKSQMHRRPTYETLVKDTILEPKDKIALPDRDASILRRMQQLTKYDDAEFLDLEKDNENIAKEHAQQMEVRAATGADLGGSIAEERAFRPDGHEAHTFSQSPPDEPGSGGMPRRRINVKGGQGRMPPNTPVLSVSSSSGGPPPPGSNGAKIMAAAAAAPASKPEQFDLTISDDMHDAHDGTQKILAEHGQAKLEKKIAIAEQIANHLGPHSATADQSYVSRLTELGQAGRKPRSRSRGQPMEISNDGQPPPGPPPGPTPIIINGGKAPKTIGVKAKIKGDTPRPRRGRSRNPNDGMAIEPGAPPPHPPAPPAGMNGETFTKGVKKNPFIKSQAVALKPRAKAKSAISKMEEAPEPSKFIPAPPPVAVRAKSAPKTPTPPPPPRRTPTPPAPPKRKASLSVGKLAKQQAAEVPEEIKPPPTPTVKPTRVRSRSKAPEAPRASKATRAQTPDLDELFADEKPRGRSRSRVIGKQPQPTVVPVSAKSTPVPTKTAEPSKSMPASSKKEEVPATAVKTKITKDDKEKEKYPPPSRLTMLNMEKATARMVKENGFNKDDGEQVAAILAEMHGADTKTRRGMSDKLREIYARNYRSVKKALASA